MAARKKKSEKPGVMIYFEILPNLAMLKPLQRLAVYEAMTFYGMHQTEPELPREAQLIWSFIKAMLDRDDARYRETVEKRRKAGKARGKQLKEDAERRRKKKEATQEETPCAQQATACADHTVTALSTDIQTTNYNAQSTNRNLQTTNYNSQSANSNAQSANRNPQTAYSSSQSSIPSGGPGVEEVRSFVGAEGLWVNPEAFVGHYGSRGWTVDGRPVQDWRALARKWDEREREKKNRRY